MSNLDTSEIASYNPSALVHGKLAISDSAQEPAPRLSGAVLDIGGQAVIEGVMMKSRDRVAVTVRLEDGGLKTKTETLKPIPKIFKKPFVRGITTLANVFILGIKALVWSANQGNEEEIGKLELIGTLVVSLFFGIGFFVGVPFFMTQIIGLQGLWFNLVEGAFRLIIFVLYVYIISFMKDIHRMFQYHGAEHMAANCYENKEELTIENIKKYSTIHARCGTSFIMLVLLISIIFFSLILTESWYFKLLWRIILIPVVAGLSYEVLKLSSKNNGASMRMISYPGRLIQRITTQKPTDDMIEVAVVSLKAAVGKP